MVLTMDDQADTSRLDKVQILVCTNEVGDGQSCSKKETFLTTLSRVWLGLPLATPG